MTIKSHFNRSTTTKTVSRVPVSFEISMWKSRLKETRLHYLFFFLLGGWLFHFEKKKKKKKTHTHYITFHKTYSNNGDISWQLRVLSDESCRYAPSDFACPRASRVQSKQGSRYGNHHATPHGTSRRIGNITWDIAANRHHYEQSKLCHMQLSQNDWLHVIRSCVSIQQNCQEARQELCRNFCQLTGWAVASCQIETTNVGHKEMRSCWHIVKYFHLILLLCTWGLNIHGYFR